MPRFVILRHECPPGYERPSHWDFMLEAGDVLRTWALAEEPRSGLSIAAEALKDHRLAYLDYEGPVAGGRGSVTGWDRGTYEVVAEQADELVISLAGEKLRGEVRLKRKSSGHGWTFMLNCAC
jgi:hypothetical protein